MTRVEKSFDYKIRATNKRLLSRGPLVPVCLGYAEIFGPSLFFELFAMMAIEPRLRKLAITLTEILFS